MFSPGPGEPGGYDPSLSHTHTWDEHTTPGTVRLRLEYRRRRCLRGTHSPEAETPEEPRIPSGVWGMCTRVPGRLCGITGDGGRCRGAAEKANWDVESWAGQSLA